MDMMKWHHRIGPPTTPLGMLGGAWELPKLKAVETWMLWFATRSPCPAATPAEDGNASDYSVSDNSWSSGSFRIRTSFGTSPPDTPGGAWGTMTPDTSRKSLMAFNGGRSPFDRVIEEEEEEGGYDDDDDDDDDDGRDEHEREKERRPSGCPASKEKRASGQKGRRWSGEEERRTWSQEAQQKGRRKSMEEVSERRKSMTDPERINMVR
eukprot:1180089-Prorocentrum_minimum.AAC.1